jgi:hypothetical protein
MWGVTSVPHFVEACAVRQNQIVRRPVMLVLAP